MKLLLHTCCGPCTIYPVKRLREKGFFTMGFFYRNNIHPYMECIKREEVLKSYSKDIDFTIIYQKGYDMEGFLRKMVFREPDRCRICYYERLTATALVAKHGKFNRFSTTLLYSKFQKHQEIKSIGEAVGRSVGIPFYYHDFRSGWKEGVTESKRLGMYRQPYCGCIYSEKERFFRELEDSVPPG